MGKGDGRRPGDVESFRNHFDRIFGGAEAVPPPRDSVKGELCCMVDHPDGWMCTAVGGHTGPHAAYDHTGELHRVWGDDG